MDSNIRQLLHSSAKENNLQNVDEAYAKLKKERQSTAKIDKPDAVSSDLFVLCAETAFKVRNADGEVLSWGLCQLYDAMV